MRYASAVPGQERLKTGYGQGGTVKEWREFGAA